MSEDTQIIQDGLWPSPIGSQSLAEGLRLSDVATVEDSVRVRVGSSGGCVWLGGATGRGRA